MPGTMWFNYTTESDLAESAAAALFWGEAGDREPMRDLLQVMGKWADSPGSEGSWFGYASEAELGAVAQEMHDSIADGLPEPAIEFLIGLAEAVPPGFDLEAFLRVSAREHGYWDMLPEDVTDGHDEDETEVYE